MSDPDHDILGDRLRLLGARMSAPALPAAEIRRRADRRRHRRRALGATAGCAAAALCLALPSVLLTPEPRHSPMPLHSSGPQQSPGPQQSSEPQRGATATATPSVSASPQPPAAFTVTSTATTTIDAGAVAGILGSCLGSAAPQFRAVIAVRTPVASPDTDGVVVAVNSAGQYVQCASKGSTGTSSSVPATFINGRSWGAGHLIEFFENTSTPTHADGRRLAMSTGHYTSEVAKVTVSYGDDPTQYPTVMGGGAFVHVAAVSTGSGGSPRPAPYVHAYDANGKEIYDERTQGTTGNARP
ncbi:hypothetical protein ACFCX4_30575 [Kitasatospora sp. NPDC056327]|uniref:hypothetical protein n=1 Tax=Kitasatospora sp. NPDC056327 TaxID=3345785 RepID=UPI0035D879AE